MLDVVVYDYMSSTWEVEEEQDSMAIPNLLESFKLMWFAKVTV